MGALTPGAVFIDGTHIKANANINKKTKKEVPVAAVQYREELMAEVNTDRKAHGKKPFDDGNAPPKGTKLRDNTSRRKLIRRKKAEKGKKMVTVSTTDPDSGIFCKGDQ